MEAKTLFVVCKTKMERANMEKRKAIEDTLYGYLDAGLIQCNPEKILSYISDQIMGFGMGEQGFVSSKQEVFDIIKNTVKQERDVQYKVECPNITIHFQCDTVASVCASVMIQRIAENEITKSEIMQSLTMRLENEKWKITTLHASPMSLTEESIDAYPLKYAESVLTKLRSDIQKETFDLINQSISGGIMACFQTEEAFPLYFINDSMLDYLDYSREEFEEKFGKDTLDAIYSEDRYSLLQTIQEALELEKDFEVRHRMRKKDGSLCWMFLRGRGSINEDGKKVLIGIFIDITEMILLQQELEQQTKELSISEERFRIALEKTSNIIFDYDIISGNIIQSSVPKSSHGFMTNIQNVKETLIIGGKIDSEYLKDFQETFDAIQQGAKRASCIIKVQLITGKKIWNRISLTGIQDETGKMVRAIGMIEDITKQKEMEIAFANEEQYRRVLLADASAFYVINFTKGIFENCKIYSEECVYVAPGDFYEESIKKNLPLWFAKQDQCRYWDLFSIDQVRKEFARGKNEFSMEYRILNTGGKSVWMKTSLHLFKDDEELKGFLYVTNIDKKKREELELKRKSERDSLTGIYNKSTSMGRIRRQLKTYDGIQSGIFMMIDVDCFKKINDFYGHPFGDKILLKVARIISKWFQREEDTVGRLGGDEFCAFFCHIHSFKNAEEIAVSICREVKAILPVDTTKPGVSCSMGISLCSGIAKSFDQIYEEADQALYWVKRHGRDGYAFFHLIQEEIEN